MEVWKPIPSYPDYEASDQGRIRSTERIVPQITRWGKSVDRKHPARILKPQDKKGYEQVAICLGGKKAWRHVHSLVAETFIGPRPAGHAVCHNNGVRTDNRVSNLRYATYLDNSADMASHGTRLKGEAVAAAKLSEADVRQIRSLVGSQSQQSIADKFGVHQTAVSRIVRGQTWSHL
jgi:hypothetical protein